MGDISWRCSSQLELIDWGEEDAVAYLKDSGDVHIVSGVVKAILQALHRQPMTLPFLKQYFSSEAFGSVDSNYFDRQFTQLDSMGLVIESSKHDVSHRDVF